MQLAVLLFTLFALAFADAPITKDSRGQKSLVAVFRGPVTGAITFTGFNRDGLVKVPVNVRNLPTEGGPFSFSIRTGSVPQSGDCTHTGDMFNPFEGSLLETEDPKTPVGDLSARHGKCFRTSTNQVYFDQYVSLNPRNKAYIGGRLIVIYNSFGREIACANLE